MLVYLFIYFLFKIQKKINIMKNFSIFIFIMAIIIITKQEIVMPHDECGYSPREKMKILAKQLGFSGFKIETIFHAKTLFNRIW